MKKQFLIIFIAVLPFVVFSQIPNNGFENWINMGSYNNPENWGTLNELTASAGIYTCTKGTPGNPGSSYIKLTSKTVTGMGIMPGVAVSGVLNTSTMTASSGFAYSGRPESFKGNWQYMAYGSDQGYIAVLLSRWNTTNQQRDTIAYALKILPGMVMSWASFTIPLVYKSGADPDSAIITASASNANGAVTAVNSYIYLDNLSFFGTVTGIEESKPAGILSIYPNPAKEKILVTLSESGDGQVNLNVYDQSSQLVISRKFISSGPTISLDISKLATGSYIINVVSGGKIYAAKFLRLK